MKKRLTFLLALVLLLTGCAPPGKTAENKGVTLNLFGIENVMSFRNILLLFGTFMLGYASRGVREFMISFKEKGYKNPFPYSL